MIFEMPPQITEPYYFGCRNNEAGHYAFDRTLFMRCKNVPVRNWLSQHDGALPPQYGPEVEGLVQFRSWPGVCSIAFWDRSVDKRGKSSSSFLLPGELTPDEALAAAREAFPTVFARFTFDVALPEKPQDD